MPDIKVEFSTASTVASVTIDYLSFCVYTKTVLGGKKAVFTRFVEMRQRSALGKNLTDKELELMAEATMNTPGIRKWAQLKK